MNLMEIDFFIRLGVFLFVISIVCRIISSVPGFRCNGADRQGGRMSGPQSGFEIRNKLTMSERAWRMGGIFLWGSVFSFGAGAFYRVATGGFVFEAFPFYMASFVAVYLSLFVSSFIRESAEEEQKEVPVLIRRNRAFGWRLAGEKETGRRVKTNQVNKTIKKPRNQELQDLIREFLS